jgi:hypothetical protein
VVEMADKKSGPAFDDIMSSAEMKPLLIKSKHEPVSCVIGLTKEKDGIVFLDKKKKPKQLLAELKKQATKIKLELEAPSLRYGHALVDTEQDAGLVKFVVNKDASGALRPKLLEQLKKAGFAKLEISVDSGLEAEPDESAEADPSQAEQAPVGATAFAPPPDSSSASATPAAEATAAPPPPPGLPPSSSQAPPSTSAAPPPPAPPLPPSDAGGLAKSLTDLVKRLAAADPAQQGALKGLAVQAQTALKSGDATTASAFIEQLRTALSSAAPPPTAAAPASTAAPAPPPTPGSAPSPATKVAFTKARLAWLAARKKVEADIASLQTGLEAAFKGHAMAPDLTTGFQARVEKVLNQLDEQLADKLDEVTNATDPAQHAKLVGEAKQVMQRYQAFIASDSTLAEIDANPFVPVAIQKTLTTTLSVLTRTIN